MELTAKNVQQTLIACLYDDSDIENGAVKQTAPQPIKVHSVMLRAGFNPVKLAAQRDNIKSMLKHLPAEFQSAPVGGDGMSFLQMCVTKEGTHWGEHRNCDELVALGLASGLVEFNMPREIWSALPGGMPYLKTTSEVTT
jgi:hypothetical protein